MASMTGVTFTLQKEYGYVVLTAVSSFAVTFWHAMRIGPFRRAAKIPYPIHYALAGSATAAGTDPAQEKKEYLFNCAQRAHGNYLENYPMFLPALLIAGLDAPVASSLLGATWLVGRVLYAVGYTRADKERGTGRYIGSVHYVAMLGLWGLAFKFGSGLAFA